MMYLCSGMQRGVVKCRDSSSKRKGSSEIAGAAVIALLGYNTHE